MQSETLVLIPYHGARREPPPGAHLSATPAEKDTPCWRLQCRREKYWRFRNVLRPAAVPSGGVRASQVASYTLRSGLGIWIRTKDVCVCSLSTTATSTSARPSTLQSTRRFPSRVRDFGGPGSLETRGGWRMETQRPHPQSRMPFSSCEASQGLSSA